VASATASHTSFFHRLFNKKAATLAAPDAALLDLFGVRSSLAGVSVTPDSAMRVPAVAAAVRLISEAVGTLPAKVYSENAEGDKEENSDHPAYFLVHDEANEWTSASQLRTQLTADALRFGNGYAFANRVNGRVQEFVRLDPTQTTPKLDPVSGEPFYESGKGTAKRIYAFADVLHIPAFIDGDGITGVSPVQMAREAIGVALALEAHAARLFGNGARPSGILKFSKKLDPETIKRIRESWQSAHSGDGAGRTAVLEDDGDFQALTFNSVDAQFAEMRHFQILEIARAFGVPSVLLMELDKASFKNAEELNLQFRTFGILPWLEKWKSAYRRVLLTREERATTSIEFIEDDLLRADTATRSAAYGQFRSMGVMTANEVRRLENLPPRPDGDELLNPYVQSAHANDNPKPSKDAA